MEIIIGFIIRFFVGICVFLFGMKTLTDGLEKVASSKMHKFFNKVSNNRVCGAAVGTASTVVTNSSTAVTVLAIGLVNAGALTLFQAVNIILGSNIGTTFSGLMIALDGLGDVGLYLTFLTVIGVLLSFTSKNPKVLKIAVILIGIGLVFVGFQQMSVAVKEVHDETWFVGLFQITSNPILLMLIGTAVTAVFQSSSAVNAVIIILVGTESLNIVDAVWITLGTNIGTCSTALLVTIGASTTAKRVAVFHLLFNIISVIIFAIPLVLISREMAYNMMERLFPYVPQMQIAWFNFWQNLISAVIIIPFIKQIVKLCEILIPEIDS